MGEERKQPAGALLRADPWRAQAPGRGDGELGAGRRRNLTGAGDGAGVNWPPVARLRALARNLLRRGAAERDMDEELRSYLEEAVEEKARAGLDPAAARRLAAAETGSLEALKEAVRDVRAGVTLEGVL